MGHRRDAAFGRELLGGREACAVVPELGQHLGGVDLAAARQALQEGPVGVLV
jgi:hypothetical protein